MQEITQEQLPSLLSGLEIFVEEPVTARTKLDVPRAGYTFAHT